MGREPFSAAAVEQRWGTTEHGGDGGDDLGTRSIAWVAGSSDPRVRSVCSLRVACGGASGGCGAERVQLVPG